MSSISRDLRFTHSTNVNRNADNKPLCAVADIGPHGREARVDSESGPQWLMLFQRDGDVRAWRNVCPHQGRALNWAPDRFIFSAEGNLICAHHGATFALPSGECVAGPCKGDRLTPVEIDIRNGHVFLAENV